MSEGSQRPHTCAVCFLVAPRGRLLGAPPRLRNPTINGEPRNKWVPLQSAKLRGNKFIENSSLQENRTYACNSCF